MAKFQRRHYEMIAALVRDIRADALDRGDLYQLETADLMAVRLRTLFTRDNDRFNVAKFDTACRTV